MITGVASGIGLAAAKAFVWLGMNVGLADLEGEKLDRACADLQEMGGPRADVRAIPTDVSRREDVQRLKDEAYSAFGSVEVLMNNAGIGGGGGPWEHYRRWRRLLEVNVWGVVNGVQTFTPAMITQGSPGASSIRARSGHHDPAWRHCLQCEQGWGEGADRGCSA